VESEGGGNVATDPSFAKNIVSESAKVVITELNDIDSRKRNIIVFGLPESHDDSADVRKQYDVNMLGKVSDHLGVDRSSYNVLACFRLGRKQPRSGDGTQPPPSARPRPLKVVFDAESAKYAFLAKIGVLRFRPFGSFKLGIKEDLTPIQMDIEKGLKEDLLARRNDPKNRGKQFKIYRKKVVEVPKKNMGGGASDGVGSAESRGDNSASAQNSGDGGAPR
jgi:hypothetical protein